MSLFPSGFVNYQLTESIITQTYQNAGMLPYQAAVQNVGDNNELNFMTARLQKEAKALEKKPILKSDIPQQYVFSSNSKYLKDFIKIRLYSPRLNRNLLQNKFLQKGVDWVKDMLDINFNESDIPSIPDFIGSDSIITNTFASGLGFGNISGLTSNLNSTISGFKIADKLNSATKILRGAVTPNRIDGNAYFDYLEGQIQGGRSAFYNRSSSQGSEGQSDEDITRDEYKFRELILPMPVEQIIDSHSHEVTGAPLNPVFAGMEFLGALANRWLGGRDSRDKDLRAFQANTGNLVQFGKNVLQATSRKSINPNTEVLYQAPNPRQFQFTWNYIPTNKADADNFILICELLKEHSYPTIDGADLFYNFPGTCDFEFWINNNKAPMLPYNKKPCLISDIMISYINGTGTYTHYYDGNPTSIVLTVTFTETELLSRTDFIPPSDVVLFEK